MIQSKTSIFSYIIFLLLLFLGSIILGMFMNTDGGGSGDFDRYAGPVMPMTSLGGAEGIEVTRSVDFDFSPYVSGGDYSNLGRGGAKITDAYRLTNTNPEAVTTTLVYGFQGQFIDEPEEFPVITVDGNVIEPQLRPSVDPDWKLWHAYNYDVYKDTLEENDFLSIALAVPELPEIPVTAYRFTDLAYNGSELAVYPMLTVTFTVDESTTVWTNLADSIGTDDEDRQRLMFRVDRGEAWLFTIGGELLELEVGGNRGYNLEKDSAVEVAYQLEVYEADFATVLAHFAESYDIWEDRYSNADRLTPEILVDGALKQAGQLDWLENSDQVRHVSDLFYNVVVDHRMMYLVFPVEIAPGQTVTVDACYVQEPSYDISGPKAYREGYDMATKLGSDLRFTALGASVSNWDPIEITDQNFGFDLEKGVTEVALDLETERYYMVVHLKD